MYIHVGTQNCANVDILALFYIYFVYFGAALADVDAGGGVCDGASGEVVVKGGCVVGGEGFVDGGDVSDYSVSVVYFVVFED